MSIATFVESFVREIDRDPLTDLEKEQAEIMKGMLLKYGYCDVGSISIPDRYEMSNLIEDHTHLVNGLFRALADIHTSRDSKTKTLHAVEKTRNVLDEMAKKAVEFHAKKVMRS